MWNLVGLSTQYMYQLHMTRMERDIYLLARRLAAGKRSALLISKPAPSERVSLTHFPLAYSKSLDPPNIIITFPAQIFK